ncbi:hypothetical protein AB4Y90_02890 [Chryseobacterium sp. 2TAF14]|uniref:hypothetical protein n=1 Tax=Chryseobacterium sp. 2TAF14 TaxID=3233007 RepID=UPI003F917805
MSKRKLLINEVFEQAKRESGRTSKNSLALYLKVNLEPFSLFLDEKTFVRYYDAFILERGKEMNPDPDVFDKLSKYLGYEDFTDFSRTFIKKDDETNKTTVKVSVDENEMSLTDRIINIIITNEQNFKMPEFMKKNGMGIMEIILLACFTTGSIAFSKKPNTQIQGILKTDTNCMYWDKSQYKPVDCQDKSPVYSHRIPFDYEKMEYFKRIERKDTLTIDNAFGKVWYSKYNGEVEFFTNDGIDPNNGRELRKATEYIIDKYGGIQEEEQ